MSPGVMLYITTLIYILEITKFKMCISKKRRELAKDVQVWLLLRLKYAIEWNIANVVLRDLDLNIQGQTFQVAILTYRGWKTSICHNCHQIESHAFVNELTLRMLYITTLTYFLRSRILKFKYLENGGSYRKILDYDLIAIDWNLDLNFRDNKRETLTYLYDFYRE